MKSDHSHCLNNIQDFPGLVMCNKKTNSDTLCIQLIHPSTSGDDIIFGLSVGGGGGGKGV